MQTNNTGYFIGAYPCAPSFHQQDEQKEREFWRQLADTPDIAGVEQPWLEHLHPLGDAWLLSNTPAEWRIVVTAVMETMRRRGGNGGFGLASSDEAQRRECVNYYQRLCRHITALNSRFPGKVIALEMQAAPLAGNASVEQATDAFARSMKEIAGWDWDCELVLEHCDAMDKPAPRKGFLPLSNVLDVLADYDVGVCINWARSAIEGRNTTLPLTHIQQTQQARKLRGLMFSGTTEHGAYGEWQDLHAPFAPFCADSLLTTQLAREIFHAVDVNSLAFTGAKLLEINPDASVAQRIAILRDGINAINQAR